MDQAEVLCLPGALVVDDQWTVQTRTAYLSRGMVHDLSRSTRSQHLLLLPSRYRVRMVRQPVNRLPLSPESLISKPRCE